MAKREQIILLPAQLSLSVLLVGFVACLCYPFTDALGYRSVALLLLLTVSVQAMVFQLEAVVVSAILSAFVWDYFFIPPRFTLTVGSTEDRLMLLMYFAVALVNGVLALRLRLREKGAIQKEEKENTFRLYNTLLNSLSHELRTPIATIIVATDNLQTSNSRLSNEQKSELLNEISVASLRLNEQVENLLNMSRLESGVIQPRLDWCDMNELVHGVVNRLRDKAGNRPLEVSLEANLPLFKLDMGLMEQVLHNLVHNAIQYIPEYCIIGIRVRSGQDKLVIIVEDNGPGFPPEEVDRVFDKFYRLKHSRTGGTGLGLSIVKGFIKAHKGEIALENMEEGGARFTLTIPAESSYLNQLKNE